MPVAFTLGAVGIAFSLVFAALFLGAAVPRQAEQAAPLVSVSALSPGEHVRIYGTISSTYNEPLYAHWVSSGKSGYWAWTVHDFFLNEGNASIWVDMSRVDGSIYGSPHGDHNTNEIYYDGDSIAVVGTVGGSPGNLVFLAEAAASSPGGFASPTDYYAGYALLFVLLPISAAAVIGGYWVGLKRYRQHAQRARQPGMYDFVLPDSGSPATAGDRSDRPI